MTLAAYLKLKNQPIKISFNRPNCYRYMNMVP